MARGPARPYAAPENATDGGHLSGPQRPRKTKGSVGTNLLTLVIYGAAGRNRTHDPLVRSQVLYPAELQPRSHKLYIGIHTLARLSHFPADTAAKLLI